MRLYSGCGGKAAVRIQDEKSSERGETMSRIITISREFGSGGRAIGQAVAEKLGIPCYDQELIEKIAEESGLSPDFVADESENMPRGLLFSVPIFEDRSYSGFSMQDVLWQAQKKVIVDLAEQGDCVMIGRCADYILKGRQDLVRIFIHASVKKRAEWVMKTYGETKDQAKKHIEEMDLRRRTYYRLYADMKWGASRNYTMTLNSGEIGEEKCVDIICTLY